MSDLSTAIMLYKKANTIAHSVSVEEELKKLLLRKGMMLLEQGEYNNYLEGTQYETYDFTVKVSLEELTGFSVGSKVQEGHQHYIFAQCYVASNHKVYALEELELALKENPQYVDALLLKAKVYREIYICLLFSNKNSLRVTVNHIIQK